MARVLISGLLAALVAMLGVNSADAQLASGASGTAGRSAQAIGNEITNLAEGFGDIHPDIQETNIEDLGGTRTDTGMTDFGAEQPDSTTGGRGATGSTRRTTRSGARGTAGRQPGGRGGAAGRPPLVPITLTIGFAYTPAIRPTLGATLKTSFAKTPSFGANSPIQVSIEKKNVVVLQGTVATNHDRLLALQMAALRPGVLKVQDRLKVAGTARPPASK